METSVSERTSRLLSSFAVVVLTLVCVDFMFGCRCGVSAPPALHHEELYLVEGARS